MRILSRVLTNTLFFLLSLQLVFLNPPVLMVLIVETGIPFEALEEIECLNKRVNTLKLEYKKQRATSLELRFDHIAIIASFPERRPCFIDSDNRFSHTKSGLGHFLVV